MAVFMELDASQSIAALLELAPNEDAARRIVAGLVNPVNPEKLRLFERIAATARARKMLDDGLERREVAYRLVGRYEISIETAYRRINAALELRRPAFVAAQPGR
jgi:hypothetical protein